MSYTRSREPFVYTMEVLYDMVADLNAMRPETQPPALPIVGYNLQQGQRGFRLVRTDYTNQSIVEVLPFSNKREMGLQLRAFMLGLETHQ